MNRIVALFAALPLAACTARGPAVTSKPDLSRAEQLFAAGCYTCLTEALAIYEKAGAKQAAFETALFLAMREKELGIPEDATLARARGLAPAASSLLDLVELTPAEPTGRDPDAYAQQNTRERRLKRDELRPLLDGVAVKTLLTTYVAVSLDCEEPKARQLLDAGALLAQHANATLLRYRLALCGVGDRQAFDKFRDADARWVEIAFFQGRRAAAGRPPNLRAAIYLYDL